MNLNIHPRVFIDLSLVYHHGYYDGLMIQAMLMKAGGAEIVMAGGRYDGLIRRFEQSNTQPIGGVGVNIAIEKSSLDYCYNNQEKQEKTQK